MFPEKDVKENLLWVVETIHALLKLPGKEHTSPKGTPGERVKMLQHARAMRKNPTHAERALWKMLRKKNLEGYKFRRQHPTGTYIVDFYCPPKKLVIEVDGGQHSEQEREDAERSRFLESRSCRVLRFWNNEVLENMDGVADRILEELEKCIPPSNLPKI
jgi:very-short-patch-repair endonuclease